MYTKISNPLEYNAALYIRLSKEDDHEAESESVTNQRSILREFAREQKLSVYDEYVDDGFSGGNYDRPAFNRLIGDIEAKKVNMVITKDLSRLGRDYIQTGYYIERYFPEKRVRYISLLDGIDTGADNSMNDLTPFKAIMNDMYAKDISRKIKSVKHDKQRRGLFIGGKAPYGYKLSQEQKNTLIIDREAAEIVRRIFQMAISGQSCREIAVKLNEWSIPPPAVYAGLPVPKKGPYSGLWSSERVTYILKNQMYIGNMVQGTTKKLSYKSKKCIKVPEEEWIIVENTHPGIIMNSDFDTVQSLIRSRKKTRVRTYDYLLKGLIFCKECGYPLGVINRVLAGDRPALYFVCRPYQRFTKARLCSCHCIRVETVTDAIVAHIKKLCRQAFDEREWRGIVEAAQEEAQAKAGHEAEIQRLSGQMSKLILNTDQLYADKLNGILDDGDFQRFYVKLKNDRFALQERLDGLLSRTKEEKEPAYAANELLEGFIESAKQNRELLCSLVEKIELTADKEVHVHFRFQKPGFAENENAREPDRREACHLQ